MSPVLPGLHPADVAFGRRGWLVYSDGHDRTLWRARADGSARLQLTPSALAATFPRLSPDATTVAFDSQPQGKPAAVFTVAAAGGEPRPLAPGLLNAHDVDWAPDGAHLVLARAPSLTAMADASQTLAVVTLATGRATDVPGSTGLAAPRWSPDGRWIAAVRFDQREIVLWDRRNGSWRVIAHGRAFGIPAWSEHGRGLYFQDLLAPGEPLYRWDAAAGRTRTVAVFTSQLQSGIDRCAFRGLAPGNVPLISLNRGSNDFFAGELIP